MSDSTETPDKTAQPVTPAQPTTTESKTFDATAELQSNRPVQRATKILNNNIPLEELEQAISKISVRNRSLYKDAKSYRSLYKDATSYSVEKVGDIETRIGTINTSINTIKNKIDELKKNKTEEKLNNLGLLYNNLLELLNKYLVSAAYNFLKPDLVEKINKPYIEALNTLQKLGYKKPEQIQQLIEVSKPPNKQDSSSAIPPSDQPCPKDKDDPISLIFNFLYLVGGIIVSLLVVIIFVLATFDLLKFNITAISQYISLLNNPNMYNKDTQDFKALMYYRNSTDTEPYTIFGQQEIVKLIFTLGTSVVGIIILQVLILLFLLIVYKFIREKPLDIGNIDFKQSAKPLGTVLIGVILAFVWSGLYQARFVNSIQPSIIYTHNNIEQVKNYIYDNLTTNEAFLTNLINGDLTECNKIINQQTNDNRIVRMIYTMSVYNFFKINISENEEAFNTVIRSIFTLPEIRVRSINPINYMYYNQNVFLPNLYPVLRPYIYGTNNAIRTTARDKIIRLDITQRINETNKRLMTLFKVPERKSQLRTYFFVAFAISLVFLFIIYALYREQITSLLGGDLLTKLKEIIGLVLAAKTTEAAAPTVAVASPPSK